MKRLLLLALALTLSSCATKQLDVHVKPTPVRKEEPLKAKVVNLKEEFDSVSATNQKLETQVSTLRKSSADLKKDIDRATAEADKLRQQETVTSTEVENLWHQLTSTGLKVADLLKEVDDANATADTQKIARLSIEKRVEALVLDAQAKDFEVAGLEVQNNDLRAALETASEKQIKTDADLKAAEAKASKGDYARHVINGFLAIVGALIIIFFVVKFILPRPLP